MRWMSAKVLLIAKKLARKTVTILRRARPFNQPDIWQTVVAFDLAH